MTKLAVAVAVLFLAAPLAAEAEEARYMSRTGTFHWDAQSAPTVSKCGQPAWLPSRADQVIE